MQYIMYGVIDKSATPAEPFQFLLPVVLLELAAASEALPLLLRLQQRHEARTPRHPLQRGARNSERNSERKHRITQKHYNKKTRKSKEEIQKNKNRATRLRRVNKGAAPLLPRRAEAIHPASPSQISHASRAIPKPKARCKVRRSRRERGKAIVIKVAATPRGPHAGGCKPHIKACLNTCSTACRSRYFSGPQNAFILAYSDILDIPPAVFFTGGKSQRQVLLHRVVCRDRA